MLYVYIGCLTFGVLYSVLSFILGAHGFDHSGADHGGVHVDHGAHDADVPTPFNPLVMASAISTFGAVGIIAKLGFAMGELLSAVVALSFAGVVGAAIFFGIVKFMYGAQSNTAYSEEELAGTEAEVVTPIPAVGVGEVAYSINGIRYSLPARSEHGEEISKGSKVKINEVKNHVAMVIRKVTINDICDEDLNERDARERHHKKGENNHNY